MTSVAKFAAFIKEREAVRMRKEILEDAGGDPQRVQLSDMGRLIWGDVWPNGGGGLAWTLDYLTHDDVIRNFRFCNVRREDDRVTRWIREHIIVPYADHQYLALMLCIARTINWPDTLRELMKGRRSWPWFDDFSPAALGNTLQMIKERGDKVYTGAYMIRAESHADTEWYSWSKQRYIAEIVIGRLWQNKADWAWAESEQEPTAEGVWEYLQMFTGWGPFMAGQVVTDLKHTRYLRDCEDWNTWTALGPGSRRGLNRLHGRPVTKGLTQKQGLEEMLVLKALVDQPGVIWPWLQPMELADVQNCLCEFDKWSRVSLGQGKTRARYVPGRGY